MKSISISMLLVLFYFGIADCQVVAGGVVAYYPFTMGSTVDASGNGNNGVAIGGVQATEGIDDVEDSALSFNGTGELLLLNMVNNLIHPDSILTISMWVKKSSNIFNDYEVLFRKDTTGPLSLSNSHSIGIYEGNKIAFGECQQTMNTLIENEWNHVLAIYDQGHRELYVNNFLECTSDSLELTPAVIEIGQLYIGDLDELIFYNRALDLSEIEDLYNEGDPTMTNTMSSEPFPESKVFPNPSSGYVIVNLPIGIAQVELINTSGEVIRLVKTDSGASIELSTTGINSGMYYLVLKDRDGIVREVLSLIVEN